MPCGGVMGHRGAVLCMSMLFAVGCGKKTVTKMDLGTGGAGGSGGGGGGGVTLKPNIGLDLTHIVGFAIAGGSLSPSRRHPALLDAGAGSTASTLYAIDDQGNFIATTVVDTFENTGGDGGMIVDAGSTTTSSSTMPTAVFDTPKYELFAFGALQITLNGDGGFVDITCSGVIMRKSDGALFCYSGAAGASVAALAQARVLSDGGDQIFLGDFSLVRIDMSGGAPAATSVLDGGLDNFRGYVVNQDADALVSLNDSMGNKALRVVKKNGGLQNLLADEAQLEWVAPSGHDFYYLQLTTTPGVEQVQLATRQADGSFVVTAQGTVPQVNPPASLALVTADNAYALSGPSTSPGPQNVITELVGATQGTTHAVPGLMTLVDARGAGTSIFVQGTDAMGNGGIVRMDVPGFAATTILAPGDFSLSAISLSKTGDLTFAGLRNSDGKHVVGNVAAGSSTYTILSATAPPVSVLQRID
jgi:hypothetical protein